MSVPHVDSGPVRVPSAHGRAWASFCHGCHHLHTVAEGSESTYSSKQGGSRVLFSSLALEVTPCPFYQASLVETVTKVHLVSEEEA